MLKMEKVIPRPEEFKVEELIPVRWSDMDAIGHVNNSRYLTFCEMSNFAWFEKVAPGQALDRAPVFPVMAHTECDFLRSIVFPATIRVYIRAVRAGRSSLVLEYLIRDADEDVNYAVVRSTLVFIERESKKSSPIPEDVRERIRELDGI